MAIQISGSTIIDNSRNIVNAGIVTASIVSANEFIGTGDKLIFSPTVTSFSPTDGATGVSALSSPNIVLTYDQPISTGVGTITLRKNSSTGTIVEGYVVGSSARVSISNQTITIDPTDNFDYNQEYYVVVPSGTVKNSLGVNVKILDTYNFTTETGPTLSSVTPADEASEINVSANIVFTFNKNIRAGTGTITLRSGSAGGTIIESYDVASSGRLTFSGNTLTIDPTNNLSYGTVYYVVIPDGAVAGYTGINTYNFTTVPLALGNFYEGGYLICQASGQRWIVAPSTAEVTRSFGARDDSNVRAQQVSGCTGWFVPTQSQMQNPGYACRIYWDSYSPSRYWTATAFTGFDAVWLNMADGSSNRYISQNTPYRIRSFRTVNY